MMGYSMTRWMLVAAVVCSGLLCTRSHAAPADDERMDERMGWWRDARFGLFIHWGLYSELEGEWGGNPGHAEWIRTTAQIPVDEYRTLLDEFNPTGFDAEAWAEMAADAGMGYIVITSKHHDGFCLFDSAHTEFDVMSTPFKRDIMAELAEATRARGLKMGWYHSIMDWNHPDYLPRRGWEAEARPAGDADFEGRFVPYLRAQVRELLTNYGDIGVMWFDGEWENTWTPELGNALYDECRKIQPGVIVNNRVSKGRDGMAGLTLDGDFAGDFGTPEQEVPAAGLPGVDWESCITMNDHWGWNRADTNWKSSRQLIETLCDTASKGGNLLLNVGPKPDGTFPQESVERLAEIGDWMAVNGESIRGTLAGPFEDLDWGRCTMKRGDGTTTLYLHIFQFRSGRSVRLPGLANRVVSARLLGRPDADVSAVRDGPGVRVMLPMDTLRSTIPVVAVEIEGEPSVTPKPRFADPFGLFVGEGEFRLEPSPEGVVARYTTDGSVPTGASPIADGAVRVFRTGLLTVQHFAGGEAVSDPARLVVRKVEPISGRTGPMDALPLGLRRERYEGQWSVLPDMDTLEPVSVDRVTTINAEPYAENEARRLSGWIRIDTPGVHRVRLRSDDGSRLTLDDEVLISNDGLHGPVEAEAYTPLGEGWHPIVIEWFNRTGGADLRLMMGPIGTEPVEISEDRLRHRE